MKARAFCKKNPAIQQFCLLDRHEYFTGIHTSRKIHTKLRPGHECRKTLYLPWVLENNLLIHALAPLCNVLQVRETMKNGS